MKIQLLILFILGASLNSFCQNILITQLTATSVTNGVNVNVKTISGTGSGYLSNTYTIAGNVIDLSVCYWFDDTLPVLQFDNDFQIPLTTTGNYIVNVHIKLSTSQVTCDNFATTDNGTTSVSYLSINNFEEFKEDFTFFPNPTNGKVEYKGNKITISEIEIFDSVGRLVKKLKEIYTNSLDLSELKDGVYLVKIQTENGNLNQKIVLKK